MPWNFSRTVLSFEKAGESSASSSGSVPRRPRLVPLMASFLESDEVALMRPPVSQVESALRLLGAFPAPGAGVLTGAHGPGARPAPDGGEAVRRERVHGQVVLDHVPLDVGVGPRRQGVDLDEP